MGMRIGVRVQLEIMTYISVRIVFPEPEGTTTLQKEQPPLPRLSEQRGKHRSSFLLAHSAPLGRLSSGHCGALLDTFVTDAL